jgi:archaellum biogenesis ATPase FlaH
MNKLVRITRTLKDKGLMVREGEVAGLIDLESPYYQSLYYYGEDALDYFAKNKNSIKSYKGKVTTNYIIFDLDSKDLDISKKNTVILIDWLKEQGLYNEYAAKIAFSGSKGFHLTLNTAYEFTPKELKSLCMYISSQVPFIEEAGFQRVDPSIYNINRQFRITNTINDKSGLFKIEMVESELRDCNMETIKAAAAKPQQVYQFESQIDDKPIRAILLQLAEDTKEKYSAPKSDVIKTFIGANVKRKHCIDIIQEGDMKDGESNSGLLRLASYYRRQGYTQEQCREKLVEAGLNRAKKHPGTNEFTDEKLDFEILGSVYSTEGYIFTCDDWFLKMKCQGACNYTPRAPEVKVLLPTPSPSIDLPVKPIQTVTSGFGAPVKSFKDNLVKHSKEDTMKLNGFRTIKQSSDSFKSFADDWQNYRVITGIEDLDEAVRMLPTGLVIINAKPGVGKTSISLNLMENCAREGKSVLFYSIDMAEDEFFTKSKSKALKISPDEVLDLYFNKDEEAMTLQEEGDNLTEKMLQNCYLNYDARITPEKIDADLTSFKEAGIKIDLVIIDYLQKMEGCGDFTSPRIGTTLMGLKSLQPKHKVCIIGLSQMPRAGGNEESPVLTAAAAKGGGVYEENASIVINLWRPMKFYRNENGNQDKYLGYMVAKNRMGQCKQGVLKFNGAISEIRSLTDLEREDYEITVEERKQREQPKVSRGFN